GDVGAATTRIQPERHFYAGLDIYLVGVFSCFFWIAARTGHLCPFIVICIGVRGAKTKARSDRGLPSESWFVPFPSRCGVRAHAASSKALYGDHRLRRVRVASRVAVSFYRGLATDGAVSGPCLAPGAIDGAPRDHS